MPNLFFSASVGAIASSSPPVAYTAWNPADAGAGYTFSQNNRRVAKTSSSGTWNSVRGSHSKSSGKWYFENTVDTLASPFNAFIGIGTSSANINSFLGNDANGWSWYSLDGNKYNNGGAGYGDTWRAGDVLSVAVNRDTGKMWFAKNGVWQASGDPAADTNPAFSNVTGAVFPMCSIRHTSSQFTTNFGNAAFIYTVPSGFSGWTT